MTRYREKKERNIDRREEEKGQRKRERGGGIVCNTSLRTYCIINKK